MCVSAFICVTWAFSLAFLFSCFVFLSYSGVFVYLFILCAHFEREKKGMDLHGWGCGKNMGGFRSWKTVIRIYCMRKNSIFNLKNGKNECNVKSPRTEFQLNHK